MVKNQAKIIKCRKQYFFTDNMLEADMRYWHITKNFILSLRHIPIRNSLEKSMLYIIFTLSIIITTSETKFWLMFLIIVFRNQGGLVYQYDMLPKILSHNGCGLWNMLYTHIWKLYLFTVTNSFHVLYVFINILITKGWDSKMMSQGVVM